MAHKETEYRLVVDSIIQAALKLPPHQRTSFINTECGQNEELRKEVYSFLAELVRADASDFMGEPVGVYAEALVQEALDLIEEVKDSAINNQPVNSYGSRLVGRKVENYEVLDVLGKGGMGIVYKARDTLLDKVVAMKVMHPSLTENESFVSRFKSEARVLGRLIHPNIVNVFTFRMTEECLFIVMEYVDGGTLHDYMVKAGQMSLPNTITTIKQALLALDNAHQQNIIHRDVKPPNILLTRDGIVKVTDFGLAKILQENFDSSMATKVGMVGGTLHYMPPEQLEGLKNVDHRGDLYGIGMTMYQMLAGRLPFDVSSSMGALCTIIERGDFIPLEELRPGLPEDVLTFVNRALKTKPDERFQSAMEMYGALAILDKPIDSSLNSGVQGTYLYEPDEQEEESFYHEPSSSQLDEEFVVEETIEDAPERRNNKGILWFGIASIVFSLAVLAFALSGRFSSILPGDNDPSSQQSLESQTNPGETTPPQNGDSTTPEPNASSGLPRTATAASNSQDSEADTSPESETPAVTNVPPAKNMEPAGQINATTNLVTEAAPKRYTVVFSSDPDGATVSSNGRVLGTTPMIIDSLQGLSYTFTMEKDGFAVSSFNLNPLVEQTRSVELTPLSGDVRIIARPFGDISIDGRQLAEETLRPVVRSLGVGTYLVSVRHPNYPIWDKEIEIIPESTQVFLFDFEREKEKRIVVTIASEPRFAQIYVNGEATGKFTPSQIEVYPGHYSFSVQLDGYNTAGTETRMQIDRDLDRPLFFELQPQQ